MVYGKPIKLRYFITLPYVISHFVEKEDIIHVKKWLNEKEIAIRTSFGFDEHHQPFVLPNNPHAHAAIYLDPDGNSIELISPI